MNQPSFIAVTHLLRRALILGVTLVCAAAIDLEIPEAIPPGLFGTRLGPAVADSVRAHAGPHGHHT